MSTVKLQINKLSQTFLVRELKEKDIPEILTLCRGNPVYYRHMQSMASEEGIRKSMRALPPGKGYEDKYFLGFYKKQTLTAIMDLIVSFPDENTAFFGLFMMNQEFQGCGNGSRIVTEAEAYLKQAGFASIRLGYVKGNAQSRGFWLKNGFEPTGVESDERKYTVVVMRHEL